ncbi:MAG TPA: hypothetical protein GX404_09660 [Syntrophomonadaceae bacterium]|jgi:hypothetical protein|nr:hypothetical protein [Syntrophomonadaceae bacterium]
MRVRFSTGVVMFMVMATILLLPRSACAADAVWLWEWKETGVIVEKVQIPATLNLSMDGWEADKKGDTITYTRQVPDWHVYQQLPHHLPLTIKEDKKFLSSKVEIGVVQASPDNLFRQLVENQGLDFSIIVPGNISQHSADQASENQLWWKNLNKNKGLPDDVPLLASSIIDGMTLGITIIALGALMVLFYFINRMRKVDELIADVYSLENIDLEDINPEEWEEK